MNKRIVLRFTYHGNTNGEKTRPRIDFLNSAKNFHMPACLHDYRAYFSTRLGARHQENPDISSGIC